MNNQLPVPWQPPGGAAPVFTMSLRELAFVVFKRWVSALMVLAMTAGASLGYLLVIKDDLYSSEAKLLVRRGQEQAPLPTVVADRAMMIPNPMSDVRSEVDILRSADIIRQLLERINIDSTPDERPTGLFKLIRYHVKQTVRYLREQLDELHMMVGLAPRIDPRDRMLIGLASAIRVEVEPETNIVTARLTWRYKEGTGEVVNTWIDLYLNHRRQIFQGATSAAFFNERREEMETRLRRMEGELAGYEAQTGLRDVERQISDLVQRVTVAREQAERSRIDAEEAAAKYERLNAPDLALEERVAAVGEFPPQSYPNQLLQELSNRLAAQAGNSVLQVGPNPGLIRTTREVDRLYTLLRGHLATLAEEKRADLLARQRLADSLQSELDQLHRSAVQWRELRRETESALEAFRYNDRKFEEASAIAALERARLGNVVVVQRASDPVAPIGISKATLFWLSLVFGIFLALSWAAVREFFDQRIWRESELRRHADLPVLAVVPRDAGIGLRWTK
ncbi:MAG: hypothetical protein IT557_08975 [Alphaproteobacteria bacterium]|nr:hypothetical protein [Alphaproteobacteria bacterium]